MAFNKRLNVLLVGKGAREHALAWKLARSAIVEHIYVVPGNAGTAQMDKVSNVVEVRANDYPCLVKWAKTQDIGLVVVGPDDAVCDGIEGCFREARIPCFAPSKEAAELEGLKTYAKDFMRKYYIPTAEYRNFDDYEEAKKYLDSVDHRVVIKVSGLAAGKGVILPTTRAEAQTALEEIMLQKKFGEAGNSIVIEEYLEGEEISITTLSDGVHTSNLSPGQDHKRIFDGNRGPNTGGMGVYAPTPFFTPEVMEEIEETILRPTFVGLRSERRTFTGTLFTGIMLTERGPKVLEYNTRFGDPETESVIPLLDDDTDLAAVLLACTQRKLDQVYVGFRSGYTCSVIIASAGYPEEYTKDETIQISKFLQDALLFHAGTKEDAGGRVFAVVAVRDTLFEARQAAYEAVKCIRFKGMQYRKDIAAKCAA